MRRKGWAWENALISSCRSEHFSAEMCLPRANVTALKSGGFWRKEIAVCFNGQTKIILVCKTNCSRARRESSGFVSENLKSKYACIYVFMLCIYSPYLVCCYLCSLTIFRLGFLSCLQKFFFCLFSPQFLSCWFQTSLPLTGFELSEMTCSFFH